MDVKSIIVGSHALFAVEGDAFTVPAPGTVGISSKPGISPDLDASWFDLGTVESFEPTASQTDNEVWKPNPGHLVLKDIIETKQKLTFKISTNDFGPFAVESLYRADQRLVGAQKQFAPLGAVSRRGWLHLQHYDHLDVLILTMDVFVRIRATAKLDDNVVKPDYECFVLASSLNTAAISP